MHALPWALFAGGLGHEGIRPDGAWTWFVAGAALVGLVLGFVLLFRSFRRWSSPPVGRDAEAKAAEARLWSTLNTNRR